MRHVGIKNIYPYCVIPPQNYINKILKIFQFWANYEWINHRARLNARAARFFLDFRCIS